ncbi:hypothetical protein [Phenylobacterium sp.]|uniref:hypothetical protein n=1 Tax=Phenylobacterium sp. TaxID=1871053 RepID=UPI00391D845B
MTVTYNLRFDDGQHWRVLAVEVEAFRERCLLRTPAVRPFTARISLCLWFDLLVLQERYGVTPEEILEPILHLERGEPASGVKPATRFRRPPLKGLWHKHWFSARFLAANMLAAMARGDPKAWLLEIVQEGETLTEDAIARIAERFTTRALEDRDAAKQLTGEWIVFLKRDGANHYLCLATHETGDQRVFDKIINVCSRDFPQIGAWIEEAAA